MDNTNIDVMVKFAIQFEIDELLRLCLLWMDENCLSAQSDAIIRETDPQIRLKIAYSINFGKESISDRNGALYSPKTLQPMPENSHISLPEDPITNGYHIDTESKFNDDLYKYNSDDSIDLGDICGVDFDSEEELDRVSYSEAASAATNPTPSPDLNSHFNPLGQPDSLAQRDYSSQNLLNQLDSKPNSIHDYTFHNGAKAVDYSALAPPSPSLTTRRLDVELATLASSLETATIGGETYSRDNIGNMLLAASARGAHLPPPGFEPDSSSSSGSSSNKAGDEKEVKKRAGLERAVKYPPGLDLNKENMHGWQNTASPAPVQAIRPTPFKLELSKWRKFSVEDLLRLCSPLCQSPDFAKLEIVVAWVAKWPKPHVDKQVKI